MTDIRLSFICSAQIFQQRGGTYSLEIQILSITFNHLLIPGKGLLFLPLQRSVPFIVFINIDKTVPFFHLSCCKRYAVNTSPGRIAYQIHAVLYDGLLRFLQYALSDILYGNRHGCSVRLYFIHGSETIFHNKKGDLITLVQQVQRVADPTGSICQPHSLALT